VPLARSANSKVWSLDNLQSNENEEVRIST
ncbi:hypothetical protein PENNAL_c0385G01191, partial [Penicillium nalgiovense]